MKNNAFGLLRLIAALMVILSHSYPIALGDSAQEPPFQYAPFSLGTIGVYLFFSISGILVTKSLVEGKSLVHFATYRILRIYPGIITCLFFTTFLIGPLFTNVEGYFSNESIYEHFFHNSALFTSVYSSLPGVFWNNPFPFGINNSIWTLVWELRAYLALLIGGLFVKRHWTGSALLLIGSALYASQEIDRSGYFLVAFFLGGLLYQIKIRRPFLYLAVISAITAASYGTRFFEPAFVAWTTFFVYAVGSVKTNAFAVLERYDLSYGLYLYAFSLGQVLVTLFGMKDPLLLFAATTLVAGVAALLSWKFIERPVLQRKRYVADYLLHLSWRRAFRKESSHREMAALSRERSSS